MKNFFVEFWNFFFSVKLTNVKSVNEVRLLNDTEWLLEEVRNEIETIKIKASPYEISRLDIETFRPSSMEKCIYGQLTLHSTTVRAKELYPKSLYFDDLRKDVSSIREENKVESGRHATLMEYYLLKVDFNQRKHIIDYLKGDEDKLTLTF